MKILIISHMYPTIVNNVKGIFVHEQVKELIKRGSEVKVIAPIPYVPPGFSILSSRWKLFNLIPDKDKIENVDVYYPRYVAYPRNFRLHDSGIRMYRAISPLVKRIYQEFQFDLIHSHTILPDGNAAVKIGSEYDVPIITTVHGRDFQNTINYPKSKEILKDTLEKTNRIVLVSNKLFNIQKSEFPTVNIKKVNVIPNGVTDLFLENGKEIKKKNNKVNIISVSSLILQKGIEYNLQAVAELKKDYSNIHYYIIGDGPQRSYLNELVNKLYLSNHVTFLGNQSREQVRDWLDCSDIFVLPSWNEGFGVVYIEAMARHLPVIGCKGEGIEDIIVDGQEGFLTNPKDYKDIKEKIEKLLKNPELRYKMGEKGYIKVEKEFTWENVVDKLIKVYQDVLAQ